MYNPAIEPRDIHSCAEYVIYKLASFFGVVILLNRILLLMSSTKRFDRLKRQGLMVRQRRVWQADMKQEKKKEAEE